MKQRSSEEQIVQILREAETAQTKAEICRKCGISEWTYYRWRQQYQGLTVLQIRRLKQLEQENERLRLSQPFALTSLPARAFSGLSYASVGERVRRELHREVSGRVSEHRGVLE